MGAATLNQPASLRASDAWSSERATRIGATRASLAAVGGVGGGGETSLHAAAMAGTQQ